MMLEVWQLEKKFHIRRKAKRACNHQGFCDLVAEYMMRLEEGNEWLSLYCKNEFLYCNSMTLGFLMLFWVQHEKKWDLWDHFLSWLH